MKKKIAGLASALRHLPTHAGPFARDTSLPVELLDRYTVGRLLREPAFCDMSHRLGGLVAPHRYLIFADEAVAIPEDDDIGEPQRGLCVLQHDSIFKVIDRADAGGHVQIALLHIPQEMIAKFRRPVLSDFERGLAGQARACFADCLALPPIPELDTDGWRDRLLFPLGFSDEGEPYDVPGVDDDGPGCPVAPGDTVTSEDGVRAGDIVRLDRVAADQVIIRLCRPGDDNDKAGPRFRVLRGDKPGSVKFESVP